MPSSKVIEFLDGNDIKYATISHSPAYTALEVAQSAHIKGRHLAKSVIISVDNRLAMVVLPASHRLDTGPLGHAIGAVNLELASEPAFKKLFPTCEPGALPPFGNLYGMDVYIADCLIEDDLISFCAGSHTELIQMKYSDYQRLVTPKVISEGVMHLGETPPRMKEHTGLDRV
jgi:Ala-tRNA(Pro) deacylase